MSAAQHTPGPKFAYRPGFIWGFFDVYVEGTRNEQGGPAPTVAQCVDEETARRIVQCLNANDELVAALRRVRWIVETAKNSAEPGSAVSLQIDADHAALAAAISNATGTAATDGEDQGGKQWEAPSERKNNG
jgi:hypothetical protein